MMGAGSMMGGGQRAGREGVAAMMAAQTILANAQGGYRCLVRHGAYRVQP